MKIIPSEYKITFEDREEFYLCEAIQADGSVLWKITDSTNYALNDKLEWEREPFPSSRTDEYLKGTRFKYDDAIQKIIAFKEKEKKHEI